MSNSLLKKVTSAVVLTALVASTVGAVSSTYAATTEVEAANTLAGLGVIADNSSTVSNYRLGDTITRREMLKVMVNLAGKTVENKCEGKFTDLPSTDWGCKYAETALAAGFIAANSKFRPNDNVSKAEALKMVMKAKGIEKDASATTWEKAYVNAAVTAGLITSSFSDYTTASKRGFTFTAAANAVEAEDDLDMDGILDGEDNTDTDTTTGTTTTPVANGDLEVSLSATTPAASDLPQGADGVQVLNFDLTAGSTDASLTDLTFERTGFGEDSAKAVYLFTEEGRVSKSKTFNSDDEANVTISPALVVKAGETVTVKVLVDTDSLKNGEFAIALKTLNGEAVSNVVSSLFDVKSTVATQLSFQTGSIDTKINAGEVQADVAEFDLKNLGNVTNSDITVSSITLKENGSIDEKNLDNLTLVNNGKEVAKASMNGKYVTFNLTTPVVVKDGKTETFTVRADILGGAADKIKFVLDTDGDITANASKYNGVNVVNNYAGTEVSVEAGELTLYSIDATNDKIKDDTDNVVLGQLKVVNVAGQNLELKNLGFNLTTTNSGVNSVLENVQLELNGTSYDLDASTTSTSAPSVTFGDTELDIVIPQGTTVFNIVADTLDNLTDGTTVKMTLDASNTSTFLVEETESDEVVSDVTPSSLTWDTLEVKQAKATISNVPLAAVNVVKGTSNITALQFEVKANETSELSIDKVVVNVSTGGTATGIAYKDAVSAVKLYKGSVSEANLVDSENGTRIAANGNVTFDGFDLKVAANATETFLVVVSTVDTDSVVNGTVRVNLSSVNIEDSNNDTANQTGTATGKLITIKGAGSLELTDDSTNTSNEEAKTVLAGSEVSIYSIDTKATNEEIKLTEIAFALTGASNDDLKKAIKSAKLYMGDTLIDTASNSDIKDTYNSVSYSGVIVFEDMTAVIPTTSTELKLVLTTENIGYEKIGTTLKNVKVSTVVVLKDEAKGANSNTKIALDKTVAATSAKEIAVVPGVVTPAITNTFATDDINSTMTLNVDFGANTKSIDGSALTATLTGLTLDVSSITATGTLSLFNGNGDKVATASLDSLSATSVAFTFISTDAISNGEAYRIETTAQASFRLAKAGVKYSVDSIDYTTNLKTTQDMGTYKRSN